MADSDLPKGTASSEPLTFDEGVTALEDILSPPEPGPEKEDVQSKSEPEDDDVEAVAETELEDGEETLETEEDAEGESEESDETDDEETGETEAVTLDDETVIDIGDGRRATLAELKADFGAVQKRVADFQRDYTRKTTEFAERSKELDEQSQRVLQTAQQIAEQRAFLMQWQQAFMPQPPQPPAGGPAEDPIAWLEYQQQREAYEGQFRAFQEMQAQAQQDEARRQQEMQEQTRKFVQEQRTRLLEKRPHLKDPEKAKQTYADLTETFTKVYGISAEDIAAFTDARALEVMLDALAYQKIKQAKPVAKAKLENKPKLLSSSKAKTTANKEHQAKKAKSDRLRKTGTLAAAVDALMDFDL